jgi:hypothetical protein
MSVTQILFKSLNLSLDIYKNFIAYVLINLIKNNFYIYFIKKLTKINLVFIKEVHNLYSQQNLLIVLKFFSKVMLSVTF